MRRYLRWSLHFLVGCVAVGCTGADPSGASKEAAGEGQNMDLDSVQSALGRSHEAEAGSLVMSGHPDSALVLFDSAIATFGRARDTAGLGGAWFAKARAHVMLGDLRASIAAGRKSVAFMSRPVPDPLNVLGRAMANVGMSYDESGMPDSALVYLLAADSVMRTRGAPAYGRAIINNSIAAVSMVRGEHGRAIDHALEAHAVFSDSATLFPPHVRPVNVLATCDVNLAQAYNALDWKERALRHASRALALLDTTMTTMHGMDRHIAMRTLHKAHNAMIDVLRGMGRYAEARKHAVAGLALAREMVSVEDPVMTAAHAHLALTAVDMAEMALATSHADTAVALFRRYRTNPAYQASPYYGQMGMILALRGLLHAHEGDTVSAERIFKEALDFLTHCTLLGDEGHPDPAAYGLLSQAAHVWSLRAIACAAVHERTGDLIWLERSSMAVDQMLHCARSLMAGTDIHERTLLAGILWTAIGHGLEIAVTAHELTGDTAHAARVLRILEIARNAREDRSRGGWLGGLPSDQRRAIALLSDAERQLARGRAERGDVATSSDTLIRMKQRVDSLRATLRRDLPQVNDALYFKPVPSLPLLQAGLGEGQVLVEYFSAPDLLYALWVGRDTLIIQRKTLSADTLQAMVDAFVGSLKLIEPGTDNGSGRSLYRYLLADGIAALHPSSLVIVPDGALWRIPFEGLRIDGGGMDGACLLDSMVIGYMHSAGMLFADPPRRPHREQENFIGMAPVHFAHVPTAVHRSAGVEGGVTAGSFGDLPATEEEVRLSAEIMGGLVFLDEDVSRKTLQANAWRGRVVHMATHAVVDPIRPERSALLLHSAPVPQGTGSQEGLFFASELFTMDLSADLVVLSACATGAGRFQRGEGVLSLARAFDQAGAANVVTSLWVVDDRATKDIMVKFYEHLAQGMGKADALAEAKRWYRLENPNAPPSHWAAFILIGDNEPVKLKKRSPLMTVMVTAGLFLLTGTSIWLMRRSQQRRLAA